MKITILFVLILSLSASAGIYSQDQKVSFEFEDATVLDVFNEIKEQTGLRFIYNEDKVEQLSTFNLDAFDMGVKDILEEVFKDSDMECRFEDDVIMVVEKQVKPLVEEEQKKKEIKGKVTDDKGAPLPGVSVVAKGTTVGIITDIDGFYSLKIPEESKVLVFSFIGMKNQEIEILNQSAIDVVMEDETIGIDEVVAIGYGTIKKSDLTGAVSSVSAEDLQDTPITSIDQGLVGRASGVLVTQTSGAPGAFASIRIRGTSSLQGGNEPLYVIDGFPIYNSPGAGGEGSQVSALSTINPSDIKSIEILKDASATSIYGARAANGVVLIATKSGKKGTDQITLDVTYGIQNVVKTIDVMNALDYANLINEANTNDGFAPFYDESSLEQIRSNPQGTDWQDELFQAAPTQNYQLGFSGGDHKMTYSVTANYFDQKGIIRNSDFKRYSGRVNLERTVRDNIKIGTHLSLSRTVSNAAKTSAEGGRGVISSAMKFNPISPVFSNEEIGEYTLVNDPGVNFPNPVASAEEAIRENKTIRLLGDIFGEWTIVPDLKARVSFGVDLLNTKFNTFIPSNIYESDGVANATISTGFTTNWLNENTLSWTKQINDDHHISLLGGITFQQNQYESVSASSQEFVNNILEENSLQSGAVYNQPTSGNTEWSLLSYIARANYNFKERYLFSLNARIDGSSRFVQTTNMLTSLPDLLPGV